MVRPTNLNAIQHYLHPNEETPPNGRLVLSNNQLVFRELKLNEALLAKLGLGPASLKNVFSWIAHSSLRLTDDQKNELKQKAIDYNSKHKLFTKKISDADVNRLFGVIVYKKGKTKAVIPTGEEIGKGKAGVVKQHGKHSSIVVKKSEEDMRHEHQIGSQLDHPNFAKVHKLYIKQGQKVKYKLEMEKVKGKTLTDFYRSKNLPKEQVKDIVQQAKDSCLYLFDKKIAWEDMNSDNIFIVPNDREPNKPKLKFIDYGFWKKEDDAKKRALQLVIGSMEIIGWVARGSSILPSPKMLFAPGQFSKNAPNQILSLDAKQRHPLLWDTLSKQIEGKNEEELKAWLSSYFDEVLKALPN